MKIFHKNIPKIFKSKIVFGNSLNNKVYFLERINNTQYFWNMYSKWASHKKSWGFQIRYTCCISNFELYWERMAPKSRNFVQDI